ncbi:MAG: alpha/beta hydrolase [Cytophagales bacterium]|nr:MAG: alpha/beta hydrolase [Cytophagales bacterium]
MQKNYTIQTNRLAMHLREQGKGKVLVMLHGWPESSYCWQELMPYLAQKFRVICPDLRGMGDSERTLPMEDYSKENLAKDVFALLDALEIQNFYLVGHDWGGIVAQEMALAEPKRVEKLVLMNISIITNTKGNLAAREALKDKGISFLWYQFFQQQPHLADAMIRGNEEVWLRHFLRLAKGRTFPEAHLQEYVRTFKIANTPTTTANFYRAMQIDMPRWMSLQGKRFEMPALYVYGARDVIIVPAYLEGIEDCFPEVTVKQIEAGHFVQEEAPEEVVEALLNFL